VFEWLLVAFAVFENLRTAPQSYIPFKIPSPKKNIATVSLLYELYSLRGCFTHTERNLSKILGFHGGDYEECRLLGCGAAWGLLVLTYLMNAFPPSSGLKESAN
jgi:hypothetical protein